MAHDGQDIAMAKPIILGDLLALTGASIAPVETLFEAAKANIRQMVSIDGRVSGAAIEANQSAAHGLAWLATYTESLRQMQHWATRLNDSGTFGEVEQLLLQIGFGEYLGQIQGGILMNQGEIIRPHDLGLSAADIAALLTPAVTTLIAEGNSQAARTRLVELMQERSAEITVGRTGLDDELEMIRDQFRRFSVDKVEPLSLIHI